ncbi:MAG: serine acetyltransferase [Eubacterium sp.]|nr:serine acetyltransferase [Eubacterium sp.]
MARDFETIRTVAEQIACHYRDQKLLRGRPGCRLPDRSIIITLLKEIRKLMFPGYFWDVEMIGRKPEEYTEDRLYNIQRLLAEQIAAAITYQNSGNCGCESNPEKQEDRSDSFDRMPGLAAEEVHPTEACIIRARKIASEILLQFSTIQELLLKDVDAGYDGDPAAKDKESIIISYPGLYAIFVYRVAHELYKRDVPFIPRIMSEYAHSRTGIDINPGATIGEYFFIDHGTGVVIGETTTIGDHVKLYQGVTLGALSTRKGQALRDVKRHPTIEDNVTIYANSTILGGETVIGHDSVISGNTFIISSVPAGTKAAADLPAVRLMPQYEVPNYGDYI